MKEEEARKSAESAQVPETTEAQGPAEKVEDKAEEGAEEKA